MSDDFWMSLLVLSVIGVAISVPCFCIFMVYRVFRDGRSTEDTPSIVNESKILVREESDEKP